jgi:hypothetical protein
VIEEPLDAGLELGPERGDLRRAEARAGGYQPSVGIEGPVKGARGREGG